MLVGNDVVDLRDPETAPAARHPRFAARVCGAGELRVIEAAGSPNRVLWAYWAAKESAFKALRKRVATLPFVPRHFAVRLRGGNDGGILHAEVRVADLRAAVEIQETADHLHAIACALPVGVAAPLAPCCRVVSAVHLIGEATSHSASARACLARALSQHLGCRPADLAITDPPHRGAPPIVLVRGFPMLIDVSLSHHGRLVAFAFTSRSQQRDHG